MHWSFSWPLYNKRPLALKWPLHVALWDTVKAAEERRATALKQEVFNENHTIFNWCTLTKQNIYYDTFTSHDRANVVQAIVKDFVQKLLNN